MSKIYVIRNIVVDTDIVPFLAAHDGEAASFFYNYCMAQNHRNFDLYCIGSITPEGGIYHVSEISHRLVCHCPKLSVEEQMSEKEHG